MLKFSSSFATLFGCVSSLALIAPVNAADVKVKIGGDDAGTKYFVIFSARGSQKDFAPNNRGAPPGHAFVAWGVEDAATQRSSYVAYGMYPASGFMNAVRAYTFGEVPGRIVDESLEENSVSRATDNLIVQVDKDSYDRTLSIALKAGSAPLKYRLIQSDCVSFVQSIAKEVLGDDDAKGRVIQRTLSTLLPQDYIENLIQLASMNRASTVAGPKGPILWMGPMFNGVPNGPGEFDIPNVGVFKGAAYGGYPSHGNLRFTDGSTYDGTFDHFVPDGAGSYQTANGWQMQGQFSHGHFENGTAQQDNGTQIAKATFVNAKGESITFNWKDGSSLTGPLVNGMVEGIVDFYDTKGGHYHGQWENGHADGPGTVTSKDGTALSGTWKNGALQTNGATQRDRNGHESKYAGGGPQMGRGDSGGGAAPKSGGEQRQGGQDSHRDAPADEERQVGGGRLM